MNGARFLKPTAGTLKPDRGSKHLIKRKMKWIHMQMLQFEYKILFVLLRTVMLMENL